MEKLPGIIAYQRDWVSSVSELLDIYDIKFNMQEIENMKKDLYKNMLKDLLNSLLFKP